MRMLYPGFFAPVLMSVKKLCMFSVNPFDNIVDDVWIEILWKLPVNDILCLRRTCKQLFSLTTLRCIWLRKFCMEVLAHHLPVPGPYKPLPDISASDLEWRTRRALDLERRWPNSNKVLRNERLLSGFKFDQVVLLPGGRHMLAVQGPLLTCWSLPQLSDGCTETVERWVYPYDSSCFITCDSSGADSVVVSSGGHSTPCSAVVLSVKFGRIFREKRRYERLPGKVIGLHEDMLLVHTVPSNGNEGGIEVLNWKSQEDSDQGTRVLPSYLDLFDGLVDVAFFAGHILIVWETCVTVIPFPNTSQDRVRIFRFETPITAPIAFTPCQTTIPSAFGYEVDDATDDNLTIIARSRDNPSEVAHFMFTPNFSDSIEDFKTDDAFAFKLTTISHCRTSTTAGVQSICLGSSGRGVWIEGNQVRQCGPTLMCIPPFDLRLTPMLDGNGKVSCIVDGEFRSVDFDEGMGRMVVAHAGGGVTVVDLD